jgi:GntR family transcriptional regulator
MQKINASFGGIGVSKHTGYNSPTPLYHRIYLILRNQIIDSTFQIGDRLPSEGAITEKFDVSRITAKRALDELAREGLVTRARGKGTFVAPKAAGFLHANFSGLVKNLIGISASTSAKVLRFEYVAAPRRVSMALRLPDNSVVQRTERVRHQGKVPYSHIITYLPEDVGRSFGPGDLVNQPILSLIEQAGIKIAGAEQSISAVLADGEIAAVLETPPGSPLLKIVRVVSDSSGRPVQHIEILYCQDRHQINMKLIRVASEDNTNIWKSDNSPAED